MRSLNNVRNTCGGICVSLMSVIAVERGTGAVLKMSPLNVTLVCLSIITLTLHDVTS
jgi:hypothetical protein